MFAEIATTPKVATPHRPPEREPEVLERIAAALERLAAVQERAEVRKAIHGLIRMRRRYGQEEPGPDATLRVVR